MEEEYMEAQDSTMNDVGNRSADGNDSMNDVPKEFGESTGYEDSFEDDDSGNFRGGRGGNRGNFRGRGGRGMPPPGWINGPPPMRFRGRGYGPGGPPMRGRGFFRGRGGPPPRFGPNGGPNYDGNWGPMGPPPPGMMGGPPPFGPPPGMMPPGGPMGPPPNMMGQPPPFGPPGIPPPNMPAPELWVETKSDEGKSYYYHARTRETTWTRPLESPTCKVVTQAEMEAMASAGQLPMGQNMTINVAMGGPQMGGPQMGGPQMGGPQMGGPQMGGPPMGGPQMGGPQMGGPQMGGPQMGGPQMGGPPMGGPQMGGPQMGGPQMGGPQMGGPQMGGPPIGMMPNGMLNMMPPGVVGPQGGAGQSGPHPGAVPPFMTQPPPWVSKDGNNHMAEQPDKAGDTPAEEDAPPADSTAASQIGNLGGQIGPDGLNPMGPGGAGPSGMGTGGPGSVVAGPAAMGPGAPMGPGGAMGPGGPAGPGGAGGGMGGAWGGGWGWAPPLVAQPPGLAAAAAAVPDASASSQAGGSAAGNETHERGNSPPEMVITAELVAMANEWSMHRAPDGRPYYYHAIRQESVWEKPQPMKDLEELQAKAAAEKREAENPENNNDVMEVEEMKDEVVDAQAHAEAAAAAAAAERERLEREQEEREREEKEKAEREKAEKEKAEKEKALDKSRPVSSKPISGTPWCVVWTGDGRVFFYNPTARESVWERPAQLANCPDVDRLIAEPPHAVAARNEASSSTTPTKSTNGELKRTGAVSDSDDSEPKPTTSKKLKTDERPLSTLKKGTQIDAGKEAAEKAESDAARERSTVPFEQRLRGFLQLLHECDVSAFSPWEKELHKIVFDRRYLLLNSEDRKKVFDKYVRERVEEERKEKKNRLQQKKLDFKQLMEEAKLHSKSSYSKFSLKYSRDERFQGIEKVRDRETYFNEHIAEVRKREKEEKENKKKQVKTDFIALLKEKLIDRRARWADIKKKVDSDPRYKAVESSTIREDYFREYCRIAKEERKKEKDAKEKDSDRSSTAVKKEKKDKEKDKEKEKDGKKEKAKEKSGDEDAVESSEAEEELAEDSEEESESEAAKEKEARAQASIKERERQVQKVLATSLRDRDKEREFHKRDEAVQHFNALLADLVRNPDLTWREAKKQLKKDHRYALAEELSKDDKERIFGQHIATLGNKRRDKLRALLAELSVGCTAHWRDVRKRIAEQPAAPTYRSAAQMEREFRDYQRDKQTQAKTALRQLLLETRTITHRSLAAVRDNQTALQQIEDHLKHDARYMALEHITEERQQIIMGYLEELEKKGPPPPPTATEPSRRAKQ